MSSRLRISACAYSLLAGTAIALGPPANGSELQFNRDVRPILSANCFACHGPDHRQRKAELRLDIRDEAIAAGAFVPGEPVASPLLDRIHSADPELMMPPPDSHKTLTAEQKQILSQWIAEGAKYQRHWSFENPVKPEIPAGFNAIDFLVNRRLAEIGLHASPEADRRTLMRRLYFDLIGLPPGPDEVHAFENESAANAYELLVDRVLQSPHYGERMAIGWLDVVRFADTCGYHSDNPRNIWPYRDWVIRSFNDNKPFDRFTLEQIAGDLLPDANQETRVGSAFNRLLLSTEEGGAQPKDYEARMLTDRVRAIGTAWLGLTTGCAQCHDHKFDPFTTRDFYALGAFFADIQEAAVGRREDGMPVVGEYEEAEFIAKEALLQVAKEGSDKAASDKTEQDLKSLVASLPTCLVTVSTANKRTVRILPRGNWMDETGEIVKPAVPHYLPQPPVADRELNRLDLAQWLVSRNNPLTARTVMNRLWKQYFGTGLSKVADDLGAQGELPPNAPLLDWLACEFMDSGWDTKHMVRIIITSATYRQVSTAGHELSIADPDNREHAHQSRFRLDAELIRDNALKVSGLLVPTIGGPSVKPYQPDGYWENLNFPMRDYVPDSGEGQHRRGLYTWWQRSFLHPSLLAFDAPSREECVAERHRSCIPQQALALMNDPSYVEASRALAIRTLQEGRDTLPQRVTWIWQQVLQRDPATHERDLITNLYQYQLSEYQCDGAAVLALLTSESSVVPPDLSRTEVAAWTHVSRVLLNLHETITRN